jgi:hypothetical protein
MVFHDIVELQGRLVQNGYNVTTDESFFDGCLELYRSNKTRHPDSTSMASTVEGTWLGFGAEGWLGAVVGCLA